MIWEAMVFFCSLAFAAIFVISGMCLLLRYGRGWWVMALLSGFGFVALVALFVLVAKGGA